MNYISGARTWVLLIGGRTSGFDSYSANLMKRGVRRLSTHVTSPAPPVTQADLSQVVAYLREAGPDANVLVAALLMGYSTLLRQSNLLASNSPQDPGHWMRFRDVTRTAYGMAVIVRSTKTIHHTDHPLVIRIYISTSPDCPVRAWDRYVTRQPHRPSQPAFILPSGGPLLAHTLLAALRLGLGHGRAIDPLNYTLHSLRRGGAQAAAKTGSSLQEVMSLGTWSSAAVHQYVPRSAFPRPPLPPV